MKRHRPLHSIHPSLAEGPYSLRGHVFELLKGHFWMRRRKAAPSGPHGNRCSATPTPINPPAIRAPLATDQKAIMPREASMTLSQGPKARNLTLIHIEGWDCECQGVVRAWVCAGLCVSQLVIVSFDKACLQEYKGTSHKNPVTAGCRTHKHAHTQA